MFTLARRVAFVPALTLVAACSGTSGSPDPAAPDGGIAPPGAEAGAAPADAGQGGTGQSPNGQLKIVSMSSTVPSITSEKDVSPSAPHDVTFVAIVTDTNGLSAIAGGTLVDDTGKTYGAFGAGAEKGTYALALTWTQITTVSPLTFEPKGLTRSFTARFFDNAGNTAEASVPLSFYCGSKHEYWACSGACMNPPKHQACGCAAKACAGDEVCTGGACVKVAIEPYTPQCLYEGRFPDIHTCEDFCYAALDGYPKGTLRYYGTSYKDPKTCKSAVSREVRWDAPFVDGLGYTCACAT